MTNSNLKGKAGERELAAKLRELGFPEAHRSQQYKGTKDSSDLLGVEGAHIECKRIKHLGWLYDWCEKAIGEAKGTDNVPHVMMRQDHGEWLVVLRIEDWAALWACWLNES